MSEGNGNDNDPGSDSDLGLGPSLALAEEDLLEPQPVAHSIPVSKSKTKCTFH
jgi:hypothetical protein